MYWEIIKKAMKKAEIKSWYALAKLSGARRNTLCNARMKNGYLSFQNTCKIAVALNISLDELNEWK